MKCYHLHPQPHTWFFVCVCNTALGYRFEMTTCIFYTHSSAARQCGILLPSANIAFDKSVWLGGNTKMIKTAKHTFFSPVFARGLGVLWCVSAHGPPAFCGTILTFIVRNCIILLCSRGSITLRVPAFIQVLGFTKNICLPREADNKGPKKESWDLDVFL